jgi:enoyl reductase
VRRVTACQHGIGAAAVVVLCLSLASSAQAEPVSDTTGGQQGNDLHAEAEAIQWDESENGSGDSVGPLTTTSGTWTPPPCWYAPTWDPEQFRAWFEVVWDLDQFRAGVDGNSAVWMWNHYEGGDPYEDFNSEEAGNGMWWGAVENPHETDFLRRTSCSHIPFWVENGEVPEAQYTSLKSELKKDTVSVMRELERRKSEKETV